MMDIISIVKGASDSLKAGKELLNSIYEMKINSAAKDKINEVKEELGNTQDKLFKIREELFKLQSENNELREEIKKNNNWNDKMNNYELIKTEGNAVVFKSNLEPIHYICPSCNSQKEIQILQDMRNKNGEFQCSRCKNLFPIEKIMSQPSGYAIYKNIKEM